MKNFFLLLFIMLCAIQGYIWYNGSFLDSPYWFHFLIISVGLIYVLLDRYDSTLGKIAVVLIQVSILLVIAFYAGWAPPALLYLGLIPCGIGIVMLGYNLFRK